MGATSKNNGSGQPIIAAATLIAVLSLASRILGLFRDRILASTFGAGAVLDSYYAAFRIPDLLFNLLGLGALSAAFLPIFVRLRRSDSNRAASFASSVASDLAIALAVIGGLGAIAAPALFALIVPGFSPEQLALTISFGRIMFLATFFLGCSAVVGSILQSERRFLAFAGAPLAYNAGIIIGAIALVPLFGPLGLAWGVVLGAALHFAIQSIAARRIIDFRFRWHWRPSWHDMDVRRMIVLLVPRIFGLASDQVAFVVIVGIASTLTAGTLAVFTFAQNIAMVPVALVGVAFAVAAFPQLAASAQESDRTQLRAHISAGIRQILLLAFPAAVVLIALKAQVVRVLLGSGAFDWQDTIQTLQTLEAFGLGLIAAMLLPLLARAFYAIEDTRTPFFIGMGTNLLGIIAAFPLGAQFGPRGLAFAMALAMTIQAALLIALLRARLGPLGGRRIIGATLRFALAALAMGVVVQFMKPAIANFTGTDTFFGIGAQGLVAAILGCAVYLAVGILLRSPEITALARALHRRVLRVIPLPSSGADEARG
ncbi:MAG: murein biosynthesis integral membrane protein MurJ [Candidatus Uhrbacteria bacterium]